MKKKIITCWAILICCANLCGQETLYLEVQDQIRTLRKVGAKTFTDGDIEKEFKHFESYTEMTFCWNDYDSCKDKSIYHYHFGNDETLDSITRPGQKGKTTYYEYNSAGQLLKTFSLSDSGQVLRCRFTYINGKLDSLIVYESEWYIVKYTFETIPETKQVIKRSVPKFWESSPKDRTPIYGGNTFTYNQNGQLIRSEVRCFSGYGTFGGMGPKLLITTSYFYHENGVLKEELTETYEEVNYKKEHWEMTLNDFRKTKEQRKIYSYTL